MKKPGGRIVQAAGLFDAGKTSALEHTEHDGADEGECDIRGNNAQSTDESHWECSLVHVAARFNHEANRPFPLEKVSAAVTRSGDVVKE
jgi:hypothetical protein